MHLPRNAFRRRRVAHVTLGLDTGGQEKLLLEFARHGDRRHFELFFLSLTTRGRLAGEIEAEGWRVQAMQQAAGFRPSIAFRVAAQLLRWGIDDIRHFYANDLRFLKQF